jgi:leucyl aminopeptidase
MSLLPSLETPRITRVRGPLRSPSVDQLDALLVMAPQGAAAKTFASLPGAQRWQELHAREPTRAGQVRCTALANKRQTTAVLGYLKTRASPFEKLALAGKMIKEASGRSPQSVGLLALAASDTDSLDALLSATLAQAFALPTFRSSPAHARHIKRIVLASDIELDIAHATAIARGNNLVRWLTALPPNKLDAPAYRDIIGALAKQHGVKMRWLDERELQRLGANAFLAVSAGNAARVAGIAHLEYRPPSARGNARPDVALIGKGILFDTGGTNLKAHRSMLDMHVDMSGSAVALASLIALVELQAPIAADAWLAITENRIGPTAYKPQDVVTAANGVTIQVIHTDAEGRMALADALALAGRAKPRLMIDYATLTGTCVYALTERMSGVFTNQPALLEPLLAAGRSSGERVWNFPFDEDYDSDIESKVADVMQCAVEGKGDQILAARFLSRFVPEGTAWAHVDLASAVRSGGLGHINTDITGFGVRYTLELLLKQRALDVLGRNT